MLEKVYRDKNQRIIEILHNRNPRSDRSMTYKYDAFGVCALTVAADTFHPESYTIERNSRGQEIRRCYAEDPRHPHSCVFRYDEEGRLIQKIAAGNPRHRSSYVVRYNYRGQIKEHIESGDIFNDGSYVIRYTSKGVKLSQRFGNNPNHPKNITFALEEVDQTSCVRAQRK